MSDTRISRIVAAAAVFATTVMPANAQDSDGCFDASGCITSTSKWSGSTLVTTIHNSCGNGVYVRVCTRRNKGNPDCGASHVNARGKYTFTGYNAHSSGDVRYTWIGSKYASKDWVCSGKVDGFNDSLF